MRITFTYRGETIDRQGVLLGVSSGRPRFGDGRHITSLYFLVKEDGVDHPKSFLSDEMRRVRTVTDPTPADVCLEALSTRVDCLAERLDEVSRTLDRVEGSANIARRRLSAVLDTIKDVL